MLTSLNIADIISSHYIVRRTCPGQQLRDQRHAEQRQRAADGHVALDRVRLSVLTAGALSGGWRRSPVSPGCGGSATAAATPAAASRPGVHVGRCAHVVGGRGQRVPAPEDLTGGLAAPVLDLLPDLIC